MGKKTLFLVIFLLNLALAQAATIQGNVYTIDLDLAQDTIIKIDTTPEQIYVSKDGTYELTINPGKYTITANYQTDFDKYTLQQEVKVVEEGDFTLDLILFPDITDEQNILDQDVNIVEDPYKTSISPLWYIGIILIITSLFLVFHLKKKPIEEDDLTKKVLKFIKEQGGRTTQKDIRKKFPVSEAKVSLIITELEHKNIIKKIKKGRGNIIILN